MTAITLPGRKGLPLAAGVVLLTLVLAASMAMGWVGYIGSDDWVYIQNARERMAVPWTIGADHWSVRFTMTLPMAGLMAWFGESEFVVVLPTLLYAWAAAVLVLVFLWRRAGAGAALLASVLIAVSPLLTVNATSMRIDAVENFYVVASLLCYLVARERAGAASWLVGAGLLAGLAFVTRPTAVALLAFFGVMFLSGRGMPRWRHLWLLAGFLCVWVAESAHYYAATGQWFYRLGIDFGHDDVVRAGSLFDAVVVAPARMLFSSHGFGLAFWLLPALAWFAGRPSVAGERTARLVRLLTLFALVWIAVFSVFASKLVLDPRYLAPALTMALAVAGVSIALAWRLGRRRLAAAVAAAMVAAHGLGLYVENKDFLYAERWLVRQAQQRDEPIFTDPQTRERALFLLQLAGVAQRVRAEPPPSGALFLAVPRNAERGRYNLKRWNPGDYRPGDWPVQETFDPGTTALGHALQSTGVQARLPAALRDKLLRPNPPVHLLRRP